MRLRSGVESDPSLKTWGRRAARLRGREIRGPMRVVAIRLTAASLNAWVKLRRFFLSTLVLLGEQCALFPCLSSGVHSSAAARRSVGCHAFAARPRTERTRPASDERRLTCAPSRQGPPMACIRLLASIGQWPAGGNYPGMSRPKRREVYARAHADNTEARSLSAVSTGSWRELAEGMRFELTVRIDSVRRFSKPLPSATRPPLRREKKPTRATPDTAFAGPV
jgi:hypothetical protein